VPKPAAIKFPDLDVTLRRKVRKSYTAPHHVLSLTLSPLPSMPFFASASGIQINGGNFIDNEAGDINIHTTQLTAGQNSNPLGALEYIAQGTHRQLLGVERNERQIGAARMRPYSMWPVFCFCD
jgi:hypothetical protein